MSLQPRQHEAFPPTQHTWLGAWLDEGAAGFAHAARHVLEVYSAPLGVYFKGCSLRWLGDADDMVRGFLADRLSRPEFLTRWRSSQRPFRYWLIVGFKHYLLEETRRRRKHAATEGLPADLEADSSPADREFDRQCALSVLREALQQAERQSRDAGLEDHWRIFVRHHVDRLDYSHVSAEFGVNAERAAVMARTAATKFKTALRQLVAWETASEQEVNDEIKSLMESLQP